MATAYGSIPRLPFVTQEHLQWSLGILLPVMKKFNLWWNTKFSTWAFKSDVETATIGSIILVGCFHSFSITIVLGLSQIKYWTAYILVLADTMVNSWSARKVIRLHQQGTEAANEQRDKCLKFLALKEFFEILIPTVFCLTFIGSYYGPNHDIMGGVGADLWHMKKTSNLIQKLAKVLTVMFIEVVRGIIFSTIFWKFFKLNMFSMYCSVIKKYGLLILFCGTLTNQLVNGCCLSPFYFLAY